MYEGARYGSDFRLSGKGNIVQAGDIPLEY